MKKLMVIALVVSLAVTAVAVAMPVSAKTQPDGGRAVFEADIFPVPAATDPLTRGEGYVRADGSVKVEIEGALPNTVYRVLLAYGKDTPGPVAWGPVYQATDSSGNFVVTGTVDPGRYGMPRFVIQRPAGQAQFTSGIEIPLP